MPVSASLTIPVTLTTPAQQDAIATVFYSAVGSSDILLDIYGSKVTLRFLFPGDIDPVMHDLYRQGLTNSATLALSIGVASPTGSIGDIRELVDRLGRLPAVSNVSFDGNMLSATVAAATEAIRSLHHEIVSAGLVPVDVPARERA